MPLSSRMVNLCARDLLAAMTVHGGLLGFTIAVSTAEAAARVHDIGPPHDTGNANRNALVHDPDGNLVELVQKRA